MSLPLPRAICLVVFAAVAGCPLPAHPPGSTPQPDPAGAGAGVGVGCPTSAGVYVAQYMTGDPTKGHTGWVLPLHTAKVETIASIPEYAPLDAPAATDSGIPAPPPTVWLMLPNGVPCKATTGRYYAATIDAPPSLTYGVELTGCAAPTDTNDAAAVALASDQVPGRCQYVAPAPAATRLGETDAQKHWQRPTKATPIPAPLDAAIPKHDCIAPGCETLYSFAAISAAGAVAAWTGAINWLTIPAGATSDTQCQWKAETLSGFWVPGDTGALVKVEAGQDHALALTGMLVDATHRMLIAEGAGEYSVYDLAAHQATLGHHVVWLFVPPEAYAAVDRLGPDCP